MDFETKKEKEEFLKHREDKTWKEWEERRKKKSSESYQRFLKEFGMTDAKLKSLLDKEQLYIFDMPELFIEFYDKPEFTVEDGKMILGGGKSMDKMQRENFLSVFFNKIIEIEAKTYAKLYNLNWNDLYQDFQIKLIESKGRHDIKFGANLLTFYKRIIRNKALDIVRKNIKTPLGYSLDELEDSQEPSYFDKLRDIDLENAMEKLTPSQKEAIVLIFFEDLTQEEAAKRLNISQQSLNDRIKGACRKMRKYL